MSQEDLASEAGLHPDTVRRLEQEGGFTPRTADLLLKVFGRRGISEADAVMFCRAAGLDPLLARHVAAPAPAVGRTMQDRMHELVGRIDFLVQRFGLDRVSAAIDGIEMAWGASPRPPEPDRLRVVSPPTKIPGVDPPVTFYTPVEPPQPAAATVKKAKRKGGRA